MNPSHGVASIVLASALTVGVRPALAQTTPRPPPAFVEGNTAFAFDFLQQTRDRIRGNLAFAPASLSLALGMTFAGAHGETQAALSRTLHFGPTASEVHGGFHALLAQWQHPTQRGAYDLDIANRLYADRTLALDAAFREVTRAAYDAPIESVDWQHATEPSRQRVDGWVARETHDHIRDLIPDGGVDTSTRLVLVNAVYFHGAWQTAFRRADTVTAPFHVDAETSVNAPLMHRSGAMAYAHMDGVTVVELPYRGGDLTFDLVLPDAPTGLPAVASALNAPTWQRWVGALHRETVDLSMPRFHTESSVPASEVLRSLGAGVAFEAGRADFSGMLQPGGPSLSISNVFHRAFVDVNEEGTEAAAATAVVTMTRAVAMPIPPVRADHPFLYVLRDVRSGTILFIGQVTNPAT